MHPATTLLIVLSGLLAVQWLGGWQLLLLAALLLLTLGSPRSWLIWLRRSRWLFVCLWLVVAYGLPGEAPGGYSWAPTYEGMSAADLQAGRLALSLGLLAWLFRRLDQASLPLDQASLPLALWSLLLPLRRAGLQIDRLVVRLALVLRNLADGLPKEHWQQLLRLDDTPHGGPEVLTFACPAWRMLDAFVLAAAGIFWWGLLQL